MKRFAVIGILLFFTGLVSFKGQEGATLNVPANWPAPSYDFKKNPLNAEKIALGRMLFYDPILSADSTVSCASCHSQYNAFTHVDHDLSHGIGDKIGARNSPALMNLAWSKTFMWDGAVNHLDVQALAPISNPLEMGENIVHVVKKLQRGERYPALFYNAFGDSIITGEFVLKSISQFMLTLVSANAKYDKVKRGEDTFTAREARGYAIFQKSCSSCHTEPLFTNGGFENNGLAIDATLNDVGLLKVTRKAEDSLKFKVPSLRNVEYTYPYMHDGRFKNLNQVLNNYIMGVQNTPTLNPRLRKGIYLSQEDKVDLIAFLLTLSDKEFLFSPEFSYPQNSSLLTKETTP